MGLTQAADTLLEVPSTELHIVENNLQRLLETGPFVVSVLGDPAHPEEQKVQASVGATTWLLGKHLPALKAADTIYSFGLEGSRAVYYCLILPADTPADALEAITDVLTVSCALSTSRQVDAAAEEADKLSGGKGTQQRQQQQQQQQQAGGTLQSSSSAPVASTQAAPTAAQVVTAAAAAGGSAPAAPGALPSQSSAPAAGHSLPSTGNPTADKVAAGMLKGSALVAAGVAKAAAATSAAIQGYVARQVSQPKLDGQPVKVSPALRTSLKVVGKVASSAAYVTGALATLVGKATFATALAIAKMLPGHSSSKAASNGEVSSEERSALKTVGAAGLLSFVQVYDALEQAAQQVAVTSAGASQQYIQYKYGDEAGQLAAESVPAATDMMKTVLNTSRLGARAIISKTAKKTASVYLKSTVAGLHPDEQASGASVPITATAGAAGVPVAAAVRK